MSVALAVSLRDGAVDDVRDRLRRAWRTSRGGPTPPRITCAARAPTDKNVREAAAAELAAARPLGDNDYKIPMAGNALVAAMRDLTQAACGMTELLRKSIGDSPVRKRGPC